MTVPQTPPTTESSGSNAVSVKQGVGADRTPPAQVISWNSVPTESPPEPGQQQQQSKQRSSIGWADGKQGQIQGEQIQAESSLGRQGQMQVQAQEHMQTLGQGGSQRDQAQTAPITIQISDDTAQARYDLQCHLEESVTPPTLLAHLRLLRLVQSLMIIDDEDLDFLFLIRSEERYLMYLDLLEQLRPPVNAVPLPPL
ncbi:hypothetical protein BGZ58_006194, partial [Dissophora ornata]